MSIRPTQHKWFFLLLATGACYMTSPLSLAEDATAITLQPMTVVGKSQQLGTITDSYPSQNSDVYDKAKLAVAHVVGVLTTAETPPATHSSFFCLSKSTSDCGVIGRT